MAVQKICGWVIDAMNEELAQKCFNEVRELVQEHGVVALTRKWMVDNNMEPLYQRMQKWFGGGAAMADKLMILDEFKHKVQESLNAKRPPRKTKWNKEYFDNVVKKDIMVRYGLIPGWDVLSKDGYHTFLTKVNMFYESLEKLREIHGCTSQDIQFNALKDLVKEHGVVAITRKWLLDNKHDSVNNAFPLYWNTDREAVAERLGVLEEYKAFVENKKATYTPYKWTNEYFDELVKEVIAKYGGIPCYKTLIADGYSAFVRMIASKKFSSTIGDLRHQYGVELDKLTAKNGMALQSFAEVAFANFLYERGVTFKRGERYPVEYEKMTGKRMGVYDFHIQTLVSDVVPKGEWVDVEVWGGPRANTRDYKKYEDTRKLKEKFQAGRPGFLGVEFLLCYKENALAEILRPYIGSPEVITDGGQL
jgi:hypothetical protein